MSTVPEGMDTKVIYEDYHVAVEVASSYFQPKDPQAAHRQKLAELHVAAASIRRHVDSIEGAAVCYTSATVCGHCEEPVLDGYVDGEPACCGPAQTQYVALGHTLSE